MCCTAASPLYNTHCCISLLAFGFRRYNTAPQININRNNINITDYKLTCLGLLAASSIRLGWEMSHGVKDASSNEEAAAAAYGETEDFTL